MRVLLTGGAGFIGTHIAHALRAAGDEVVVFDREPVTSDAAAICGDVTDLDAMTSSLRGVDAICHQAAKVGLGVDFGDAVGYVTDNDLGTAVLLTAMHAARFRGPLVLASSMVVAYALRGSVGAVSGTDSGSSGDPQSGQGGSYRPASRSFGCRGPAATMPCSSHR